MCLAYLDYIFPLSMGLSFIPGWGYGKSGIALFSESRDRRLACWLRKDNTVIRTIKITCSLVAPFHDDKAAEWGSSSARLKINVNLISSPSTLRRNTNIYKCPSR